MPPVFGPVSPSPTRLWSCAVPKGRAVVPSERQKKLASSPVRHSSITTSAPARPMRPAKQASTAATASSRVAATVTPLPAASPSALTTIGAPCGGHRPCAAARVAEMPVGGGRDARFGAQRLGVALRAFQSRRFRARTEGGDARAAEIVGEPGDQRRLRPDDDEVDRLAPAEGDDRAVIGRIERDERRRVRRCPDCPAPRRAA